MTDCKDCRPVSGRPIPAPVFPAGVLRLDEAARAYIGVPFLHQGRDPKAGLDCVGLGYVAARDCGIDLPHAADYGRNPAQGELERRIVSMLGQPVPFDTMRPGDVVTITFMGQTRHVAIVGVHPLGGLSLIHTASNVGRVVEVGLDAKWAKRITGVYRVGGAA